MSPSPPPLPPSADPQHLRQAIAALESQRGLLGDAGFVLRVGVHAGEAAFGAGFEADNTLTGDAVNVAARLALSAPPGGLRISADTWAQVRGRFIADEQPPLQLKGLDKPLQTWLVHAPAATSADGGGAAERGVEGLRVAMVGRDAELARLQQAIASAGPGGSLQAVTVVAAAGLGKTRLFREALAGVAARGLRLLRARAHMAALVARQDLALGNTAMALSGVERATAAPKLYGHPGDLGYALHAGLACFEVLSALGDLRAGGLLAQMHDCVQALTLERGGSPEAAHALQKRIPIYRSVMQGRMDLTISAAAS